MDIVSAGLLVSDIILHPVDKEIFSRDSAFVDSIKYTSGGDALNVAINLAKLGASVGLCGVVGRDGAGEGLLKKAAAYGVDISPVVTDDTCATSTSVILTESCGERHCIYNGDANNRFSAAMVPDDLLEQIKILFVGSAMLLASLDGDGLAGLFSRAKKRGVITAMDATSDPYGLWLAKIEKALAYTDIFIPSYEEAQKITGKADPEEMLAFMQPYGLKIFGVKLGKAGCFISDFDKKYRLPAFPCDEVKDTTGAGDAFMSGFLYGALQGWDFCECAVFGGVISNFCIRELGAVTNTPDAGQAFAYLEQHR